MHMGLQVAEAVYGSIVLVDSLRQDFRAMGHDQGLQAELHFEQVA